MDFCNPPSQFIEGLPGEKKNPVAFPFISLAVAQLAHATEAIHKRLSCQTDRENACQFHTFNAHLE